VLTGRGEDRDRPRRAEPEAIAAYA
jgi:hypothetical protein